nr:uncharacterized protein LOC131795302 isoform X1 [Pocillopora verrucosa]
MHSDCSLLLDCHYLKTQIILVCLLLTLKQITAIDCSYSAVLKGDFCFEPGDHVTEEGCRRLSEECCVHIKNKVKFKCFRTKEKQPHKGGCSKVSLVERRPLMNQFLEGDVLLEFRVVSELHCWDHCIRYNYCKAYNYHQTSDPSLENCQLLKSDIGLLKAREGHTYYVIPEQNKDSQLYLISQNLLGSTCR